MKAKLTYLILTSLMLFAFQNCGSQYGAVTYNMSQNRGNAMDPGKVAVGPSVWPRTDSTVTNPVPLNVTRAALPIAIDFDSVPNYIESTATVSWGNWISAWKQLPLEFRALLGPPKYTFRLDLFKNAVINVTTDELVYVLSPNEVQELTSIMSGSILANSFQFNSAAAFCTASVNDAYASLETDYGMFDLSAGQLCAGVDLFRNDDSGNAGGLQNFLNRMRGNF